MKIVLASEVFPPRAGGAGWSTRALALGLRDAGHEVSVLTTSPGPAQVAGIPVRRLVARGRTRLAVPRAFARALQAEPPELVHAQHSLSALGCLAGAHAAGRPRWPARSSRRDPAQHALELLAVLPLSLIHI